MSSSLRISIILVLLLATTALGLIGYNVSRPKQIPAEVAQQQAAPAPATVGYFVAARPLARGALVRDDDFVVRSAPPDRVPPGAILETPDSKAGLPGALVRKFVDEIGRAHISTPVTVPSRM